MMSWAFSINFYSVNVNVQFGLKVTRIDWNQLSHFIFFFTYTDSLKTTHEVLETHLDHQPLSRSFKLLNPTPQQTTIA